MASSGWIKLHRRLLKNPIVMKDGDYLAIWTYLLLTASHEEYSTLFGGKKITLEPGQLITGRKKIASELRISESKVNRVLNAFEIEQQIEQQKERYGRLISICSWGCYQKGEQQNEQQVNNERTTSEQRVNTIQEDKEYKEDKELKKSRGFAPPTVDEVREYCLERGNSIDPERFIDYYEQQGWKLANGNKMKDWKASIRIWERKDNESHSRNNGNAQSGVSTDPGYFGWGELR